MTSMAKEISDRVISAIRSDWRLRHDKRGDAELLLQLVQLGDELKDCREEIQKLRVSMTTTTKGK